MHIGSFLKRNYLFCLLVTKVSDKLKACVSHQENVHDKKIYWGKEKAGIIFHDPIGTYL